MLLSHIACIALIAVAAQVCRFDGGPRAFSYGASGTSCGPCFAEHEESTVCLLCVPASHPLCSSAQCAATLVGMLPAAEECDDGDEAGDGLCDDGVEDAATAAAMQAKQQQGGSRKGKQVNKRPWAVLMTCLSVQ